MDATSHCVGVGIIVVVAAKISLTNNKNVRTSRLTFLMLADVSFNWFHRVPYLSII
jgi:hypothetical protein